MEPWQPWVQYVLVERAARSLKKKPQKYSEEVSVFIEKSFFC
jgi:hypothetical protein